MSLTRVQEATNAIIAEHDVPVLPDPSCRLCCAVHPSSLWADAQWVILEPLLPHSGNVTGPRSIAAE
ncbi:hypothetical protein [Rhodococcus sp. OK302]|uniref:hypothetical protein n=1 Tax=Rhodococcus sp. OK302 TaxID=1882769 RepID=UPI000B93CD70|nr:hypothetical protein [Rhodococcus sp. OK302]